MLRAFAPVCLFLLAVPGLMHAQSRDSRARVDVEKYVVDASINPRTQSVQARAQVRFAAVDSNITSATFELHNSLNVTEVKDEAGNVLPSTRLQADFSVRVSLPQALAKGESKTLTFTYEGRLTGNEESPIYGLKFAAIQTDFSYLTYPSRWFPVNDYTTDRYEAEWNITVPKGYAVLFGETGKVTPAAETATYQFTPTSAGFSGSLAIVKEPAATPISSKGVTVNCYFRTNPGYCQTYADEAANILTYLTSIYGLAPSATLTLVETENGAPNGFSAPRGLIFLAPNVINEQPAQRVLTNQLARQWYGNAISTTTRNHLWILNGMAKYAEALYLENQNGAGALETEVRDFFVDALTVNEAPLIQSARLEDYSPEFWAMTASKGASVLHMLRSIIGDKGLEQLFLTFTRENLNKSVNTEMFRKAAEKVGETPRDLQNFFVQWIESTGAPEFKMEYTVFRGNKTFRILGKISQDLDTFRMPVDLLIETEGNPEKKTVEVVGTSSEFFVESFGKPKRVTIDPEGRVLRNSPKMRVAVAIRRGEQLVDVGEFGEALKEYQKALDVSRNSSLAHYRIAEVFFLQSNLQSAANEFREALNGDLEPRWVEVWSHINLGKVFDITGQRERAVNEYNLAVRTKDNTQGAQLEAAKYLKEPYKRQRTEE